MSKTTTIVKMRSDGQLFRVRSDGRKEELTREFAEERAPYGDAVDTDNPPLSPRAAIQSAHILLSQLMKDADKWRLASVKLQPILFPDAWIYVVVIGALVSIGLFFLGRYSAQTPRQSEAATASLPPKSIAVLPFDNLSRDPDNAYFCEGVQDEPHRVDSDRLHADPAGAVRRAAP